MACRQLLLVLVDEMLIGIDSHQVIEIVYQQDAQHIQVPLVKAPFTGGLVHRDRVLPVLDMRVLFDHQSFEDEMNNLRATLDAREADHVAWLEALRESCATGSPFTKATDPSQCAFGKWYDDLCNSADAMAKLTGGDRTIGRLLQQFDQPHRAIHGIAVQALQLAGEGQIEESEALIQKTWNAELARMRCLFAQLISAVEKNRKAITVVVELESQLVACTVDGAQILIDMPEDAMQQVSTNSGVVEGIFPTEKHGEVMILNLAYLADLLGSHGSAMVTAPLTDASFAQSPVEHRMAS